MPLRQRRRREGFCAGCPCPQATRAGTAPLSGSCSAAVLAQRGRRDAEGAAERVGGVAVTRESELERNARQIPRRVEHGIECRRESRAQLVAMQRYARHAAEAMRKIERRATRLAGKLAELPRPARLACERHLCGFDDLRAARTF